MFDHLQAVAGLFSTTFPFEVKLAVNMGVSDKIRIFLEQGSWIRRMFEEGIALKKQYGEDAVFDLSLGNPVMEPPEEFFDELYKLVQNPMSGRHRYMQNAGYTETRDAVATQLSNETGMLFTSEDVVMVCGAGGGLNVVLKTILDPGDEVVIFAPFFVEYKFYIDNQGGVSRVVRPKDDFLPDIDHLKVSINERTKAVLINSPNNPTGIVYSSEILQEICAIIKEMERRFGTEIFLLSDEPYRKLIFDGLDYPYIFSHHSRSIAITSHSKDLAIPGERIGYIAVAPQYEHRTELVDGLIFCNRILGFVNAPALMQNIVRKLQRVTIDVEEYQRKRDCLYEGLTEIGYDVVKPQGAFYMFPKSPIEDDVAFVEMLKQYRVLVVPGSGFGFSGHFRISFCVDDRTIEGSLAGFRNAVTNLEQIQSD